VREGAGSSSLKVRLPTFVVEKKDARYFYFFPDDCRELR